jgi:predicted TIM-barrel fold metal-dependent hydrolase
MSNSTKFTRRKFISAMSTGPLVAGITAAIPAAGQTSEPHDLPPDKPEITDTNVHLFKWPFRRMKYEETKAFVDKLHQHRITKAWAANFEGVFSKSINSVNSRLADECTKFGKGMLIPFGAVNIMWPDWEEDLRRCDEVHKMPGIRIYPAYQTYDLSHENFPKLVNLATERGMIVQIVGSLEDLRVQHPLVESREIKFEPILDVMKSNPKARIELLGWSDFVDDDFLKKLVSDTTVMFDISWLESTGGLGRLIDGTNWHGLRTPVPVERIMFGSYAPYFPLESAVMKLFESPLTLDQMKSVMNVNANNFIKQVV